MRRLVRPEAAEEGQFIRGVRFGIGFMLAVVTILLLIVVLLLWLSTKPGWREWVEQLRL